jgi:predicted Fe-Mo cluster-binding NifX family protein
MRIVIGSEGRDLDAASSASFGRCPVFLFVETETLAFEALSNPAAGAAAGAGVQAAQMVVAKGAQAVLAENVGPNAFDVFDAAGVPVYVAEGGSVREAVSAFTNGDPRPLGGATMGLHRGLSSGSDNDIQATGLGRTEEEPTMRIAVSADDSRGLESVVAPHFGRCPYFIVVEVEGREAQAVEAVRNPYFEQHQPGQVPGFVAEQNVDVMLTGGMGGRAIAFFRQFGIEPVTGAQGTVRRVVEQYLGGDLSEAEACRESVDHGHGDEPEEEVYEEDELGRLREEIGMLRRQLAEVTERLDRADRG